jgi:hypothetical protein
MCAHDLKNEKKVLPSRIALCIATPIEKPLFGKRVICNAITAARS